MLLFWCRFAKRAGGVIWNRIPLETPVIPARVGIQPLLLKKKFTQRAHRLAHREHGENPRSSPCCLWSDGSMIYPPCTLCETLLSLPFVLQVLPIS